MTIFDLNKTPLSPFLIRMITVAYQEKLRKLSGYRLSTLLCSLGILRFESNSEISSEYAEIKGVNSDVYDSYNENPFFQWAVCYHLDSLGLLYDHPRVYFEKFSKIKKYWSSSTRVRIPAGFIPQSRYESRKKAPTPFCRIDESLKFDPESFKTITVEEVNELKRQAFLKQEDHHYYLHSERNRAIKEINERRNLTLQQKKSRVKRIEEKYQRNLTKYMEHVNSIVRYGSDNLRMVESGIAQKEKLFHDLSIQLANLKVAEQLANDEEEKVLATKRRVDHERKQYQAEQSLIEAMVHLEKLKVYYQVISKESVAVQQQLTPILQERYFAGIQSRKTHADNEIFLQFMLSDFDDNVSCIRQLDILIKDVDSNLEKIQSVVDKNYRINSMRASFDVSTRIVRLYLGHKAHDIELSHYLHHLKEVTRKSDIERIKNYINEICSNITVWITGLVGFGFKDLSKIRDTVKLYWRASFDISTKTVCLINETKKVEHLNIPDYIKYLTRKIEHFQEILAEKQRMCK